ncbi:MAG TPA: hypothetical protein VMX58_06495 [Patescibacteria group bacterium]|nr:hypothetical protein [Patescibacteria group bacterium]
MDYCRVRKNREVTVFVIALALLCAGFAPSATLLAAGEDLPAAAEIIDRYVAATGGREAYGKIQNRVTTATIDIPMQGITMDMTIYSARPDNFYSVMKSAMLGTIERGFDGEVAWENSLMSGPQIKKGTERGDIKRDAVFDKYINWRELYKEVACTGIDTLDGGPAYKVLMTPNEGNEQTIFFDKESGLIVRIESVVETPMGTVPFVTTLNDYRDVGGVLIAHKMMVTIMGQNRLITAEKVEYNVELPAGLFDLPAEIRELVEKREE